MVQPLWLTVQQFLKKLKIELPNNPAIPLLGIYPDKIIIKKEYICSNMDGHRDYDSLSKVSQRGNTVCHPLYVESKKK